MPIYRGESRSTERLTSSEDAGQGMELRQTGSCISYGQRFWAASMSREPVLCLVPVQLLGSRAGSRVKLMSQQFLPRLLCRVVMKFKWANRWSSTWKSIQLLCKRKVLYEQRAPSPRSGMTVRFDILINLKANLSAAGREHRPDPPCRASLSPGAFGRLCFFPSYTPEPWFVENFAHVYLS